MNALPIPPEECRIPVIAAVATAPGRGGIGIIRVSGGGLEDLMAGVLGMKPEPRRATRCRFRDALGGIIDTGLAVYFPAPHSYTGDDVLELQGHGGPVVLQMLLRRCIELGARIAAPGEFTRRAFLNGKLDLAQAEAVADLIEAATETSARFALRSLQGEFSAAINKLVAQLVETRMLVEAVLDFPEEEIDATDKLQIGVRLANITASVSEALTQGRRGSVLRSGLTLVIAGRPNRGKSSLMNALAGDELAIVTATPGTTRDVLRQTIQVEGVPINIVDTAGLRESADEVEQIGVARAWQQMGRADSALLVIDDTEGVTDDDRAIAEKIPGKTPCLWIHNKIDLSGHAPAVERDAQMTRIYISAKTGAGLELLRTELLRLAGWQTGAEDVFMARARHLEALENAVQALERAGEPKQALEIAAEELRLAHLQLQSITGAFSADDLLGEIFSQFCIGK